MAHQQERPTRAVRVIIEQDAGFTAWISDQFGSIIRRFNQLESTMKTIEEYTAAITAAQEETAAHIGAIKQDVTDLLAAVAAIPTAGLTQAQADALDTVVARGQSILDSTKAVDEMAPVASPVPTPTPEPAPAPSPAPSGGL